jgi:hypothetical protein
MFHGCHSQQTSKDKRRYMYPLIIVPDDAADLIEQLGSRPKIWYHNEQSVRCLYKEVRVTTGEDWSEKAASELCSLLELPHAHYDFATWKGTRGVVTPTIVPAGGRLVHGNELLVKIVPEYPGAKSFRVRQHTLNIVLTILRAANVLVPTGWAATAPINSGAAVFVGYLMLDALIGNTDRHHENWSLVVSPEMSVQLAPTYDHASSLGRNESDENRRSRLSTRDEGWSINRYVERTGSAFYPQTGDRPLTTYQAFAEAAKILPRAGKAWLQRLEAVPLTAMTAIFEQIPRELISQPAVEFGQKMLELNRERLLALKGSL